MQRAEIQEKRKRLNMSRKELADAIGLPKSGEQLIREVETQDGTQLEQRFLKKILSFPESPRFPNNENAKYKAIDLFAGIGGIRLGFHQTGKVKTVFSSEWDRFSQKTYRANFGEVPEGDITKIESDSIPNHDILLAGFPCQAFSLAGKKLGLEDTRGTLFFDVARILEAKRPKAFLLENVKNLKSHDKGRTYAVIEESLNDLDYEITPMLFKARDFGPPQNRERIYIVGFDKTIDYGTDFKPPVKQGSSLNVGSILETDPYVQNFTISDRLWEGHQVRKRAHQRKGNGFGYSLFTGNSPYTSTISARYYKDGSEILIDQPGKNPRKITPREAARLQGFPDNYVIPVSNSQAYRQFGNSVCVPVINAIAEQVVQRLDSIQ